MNNKTNRKKVWYITAIVIAVILISVSFITSTTYTQLAVSSLLYPPLAYFAFKYFPIKGERKADERLVVKVKPERHTGKKPVEIVDIDKRAFLKMLGAAGFSFFIFSLFTRRVEDLILSKSPKTGSGSFADTSGEVSASEPTEGYKVTEIATEDYNYYGFVNTKGHWYIMRENPDEGSFRYVKGITGFSRGWEERGKLKYDYYHKVFK